VTTADHKIQLRQAFTASAVSNHFSFAGTSVGLTVVGAGTAELQHSNMPAVEASWETLATQAGDGTAAASTERAFGRVVMTGAGSVAVSCAGAKTGAGGGGGGGDASEARQNTQITAANLTNTRIGAVDEAAAAADGTGNYSLIAAVKRGLLNWAALLARMPTLGAKAGSGSVSVVPATGTATPYGGAITTGGTQQTLVLSNANRRGLTLQNTSAGELRVNPWGTAASATLGYVVQPGLMLVLDAPHCDVREVSIWGATTGQTFQGGEAV
jgi:hypothetical protein